MRLGHSCERTRRTGVLCGFRHSKLEPILVYAAVLTRTDKIEPCYFLTSIGLSLMLRNAMLP